MNVENWLIPISITIVLGTLAGSLREIMFVAYSSLFGLFYMIGNNAFFKDHSLRNNAYRTIGSLGTLVLLFILSFDDFWSDLRNNLNFSWELADSSDLWITLALTLVAAGYLYSQQKNKPLRQVPILSPIFLLFIAIFFIGITSSFAVVLINFVILIISILTIIEGTKQEDFGILNFGLTIITVWIIIRFLNSDLSFVIRGLLLIAIGVGFFSANYWMLKKRRRNEL